MKNGHGRHLMVRVDASLVWDQLYQIPNGELVSEMMDACSEWSELMCNFDSADQIIYDLLMSGF